MDAGEAERALSRQSWSAKHELLFQRGINFNDLPPWQRRGVGLLWEEYERPGTDPRTGTAVSAITAATATDANRPNFMEFIRIGIAPLPCSNHCSLLVGAGLRIVPPCKCAQCK